MAGERGTRGGDDPGGDAREGGDAGDEGGASDVRTGSFKLDVRDDGVREWEVTADGVVSRWNGEYTPSIYAAADERTLDRLRGPLDADPRVAGTGYESWHTDLRADEPESVLRIDVATVGEVRSLAGELERRHQRAGGAPGTLRLFNVDFSPQFRYCLERDVDAKNDEAETRLVPALGRDPPRDLRVCTIDGGGDPLAREAVPPLAVDDERFDGDEGAILDALGDHLDRTDPDVLLFADADLIALAHRRAEALGVDLQFGRLPGWTRLSRGNTYEHEGRVGYAPARYDVPGRVILNRSNSFLLGRSGFEGVCYLVEQSGQPIQETGWASIGTVLTAIQTREALLERDVLVPYNKSQAEFFKDPRTLQAADRGGATFEPIVGRHERVFELDFAALYPNIMVERNVSPETVCCDCHADRADVPELGYSVCDERGFLADVLEPLVTDRAAMKDALATATEDRTETLESRRDALKWVLVSCFGYQGYRNSKFGRIEAHEAINAYARDILLTAKRHLEDHGWRLLHGIVDSLWVTPAPDRERAPLDRLAAEITAEVGIELELEREFDWLCLVPKRGAPGGALNRYFGSVAGADEYKFRGIELRQRSTCRFVAAAQRELIETLDATPEPAAVCDRLRRQLSRLRAGDVPASDLAITRRVSKERVGYERESLAAAALERAARCGVERHPGQSVRYVVVDDDARTPGRVRLALEGPDEYDADFYARRLVRACESVVSPLGWDRERIEAHLADGTDVGLAAFG